MECIVDPVCGNTVVTDPLHHSMYDKAAQPDSNDAEEIIIEINEKIITDNLKESMQLTHRHLTERFALLAKQKEELEFQAEHTRVLRLSMRKSDAALNKMTVNCSESQLGIGSSKQRNNAEQYRAKCNVELKRCEDVQYDEMLSQISQREALLAVSSSLLSKDEADFVQKKMLSNHAMEQMLSNAEDVDDDENNTEMRKYIKKTRDNMLNAEQMFIQRHLTIIDRLNECSNDRRQCVELRSELLRERAAELTRERELCVRTV